MRVAYETEIERTGNKNGDKGFGDPQHRPQKLQARLCTASARQQSHNDWAGHVHMRDPPPWAPHSGSQTPLCGQQDSAQAALEAMMRIRDSWRGGCVHVYQLAVQATSTPA